MNAVSIRYDPLLAERLAREIEDRWRGAPVRGLRFHRSSLAVSLDFASGEALACLLQPGAGHVLAIARGSSLHGTWSELVQAEAVEAAAEHRFRRLALVATATPADERCVSILLGTSAGRESCRLVLELRTHRWNALLVGAAGRIEDVLRPGSHGDRTLRRGNTYQAPRSSRRWVGETPAPEEWRELFALTPPPERRAAALREVAWVSAINVDWMLGAAADSADLGELDGSLERYRSLRVQGGDAFVLDLATGRQPYPAPVHPSAERCPSLLAAMENLARSAAVLGPADREAVGPGGRGEATDVAERDAALLRRALNARLERMRRRRLAMERQLEGPAPADLRSIGQLLLARQDLAPRGSRRMTLTGFDGRVHDLELEPGLGPVENAERFFERARRRERALRRLPAVISALVSREAEIRSGLADLEATGPSEELRMLAGRAASSESPAAGRARDRSGRRIPSLPYRSLRSSGGLEIRVGRSARANDDLTFRHAAPDDIWLHARQARGAHVVLRWGRRDQNPPRADLEEAALVAAVFSDARHSGWVAVDWTRRKYVRKPRKSAPGTVVPDRVATLFVEPDADRVRALREEE